MDNTNEQKPKSLSQLLRAHILLEGETLSFLRDELRTLDNVDRDWYCSAFEAEGYAVKRCQKDMV